MFGTNASRFRCRISSAFTGCSMSATTFNLKKIFAVAGREGYTADLRHIIFGSVLGEDRKLMKTRSGENVPLRGLVEEACRRARKIIDEKNPGLSEDEKNDIAEKIGIGAVKY